MSDENEEREQQPEHPFGAEPTVQFDAFTARQADDREQQAEAETHVTPYGDLDFSHPQYGQAPYNFPPEYAADPSSFFPPTPPPAVVPPRGTSKLRSVAILAGAIIVAGGIAWGAYAAFGSSSTPASASTFPGGTPAPTGTAKHTKPQLTLRVKIESIATNSFTGTIIANGQQVTVTLTAKTHFGTKARPLTRDSLAPGETVTVRGRRTGETLVTASAVAPSFGAGGSPSDLPSPSDSGLGASGAA